MDKPRSPEINLVKKHESPQQKISEAKQQKEEKNKEVKLFITCWFPQQGQRTKISRSFVLIFHDHKVAFDE